MLSIHLNKHKACRINRELERRAGIVVYGVDKYNALAEFRLEDHVLASATMNAVTEIFFKYQLTSPLVRLGVPILIASGSLHYCHQNALNANVLTHKCTTFEAYKASVIRVSDDWLKALCAPYEIAEYYLDISYNTIGDRFESVEEWICPSDYSAPAFLIEALLHYAHSTYKPYNIHISNDYKEFGKNFFPYCARHNCSNDPVFRSDRHKRDA